MNYHINTILVWDSFKKKDECPICLIENDIEKKIVSQYLNEAVMEDEYRNDVNKYGFCKTHFKSLYSGENKLGLALQTDTRLKYLMKSLKITDNLKEASKISENIKKELSSCIICKSIEFEMKRYFETIPKMYKNEKEFEEIFKSSKGFCLEHFARLLDTAKFAGAETKEYLTVLTTLENQNTQRLEKELLFFTEKFDYRNSEKSWGTSEDALPRSINKIHGNIINKDK